MPRIGRPRVLLLTPASVAVHLTAGVVPLKALADGSLGGLLLGGSLCLEEVQRGLPDE